VKDTQANEPEVLVELAKGKLSDFYEDYLLIYSF
jgi:hypothetical protein